MEIISFRFQDFLSAFIILFAVIDITGLTPIIIDMKQKGQNIIAWKAAVYSLVTFLAFLFMGNMILNLFQVDISSFAIAGALVIFVMAIEMLLGVEIFRNDGPEGRHRSYRSFSFDCRRRLFYDSAVVEGSVWVG